MSAVHSFQVFPGAERLNMPGDPVAAGQVVLRVYVGPADDRRFLMDVKAPFAGWFVEVSPGRFGVRADPEVFAPRLPLEFDPGACPACGRGGGEIVPVFPAGFHGPACPFCDWDDPIYFEGGSFQTFGTLA